jgi:hypothetical protein
MIFFIFSLEYQKNGGDDRSNEDTNTQGFILSYLTTQDTYDQFIKSTNFLIIDLNANQRRSVWL